jgi:hypothetical protein
VGCPRELRTDSVGELGRPERVGRGPAQSGGRWATGSTVCVAVSCSVPGVCQEQSQRPSWPRGRMVRRITRCSEAVATGARAESRPFRGGNRAVVALALHGCHRGTSSPALRCVVPVNTCHETVDLLGIDSGGTLWHNGRAESWHAGSRLWRGRQETPARKDEVRAAPPIVMNHIFPVFLVAGAFRLVPGMSWSVRGPGPGRSVRAIK